MTKEQAPDPARTFRTIRCPAPGLPQEQQALAARPGAQSLAGVPASGGYPAPSGVVTHLDDGGFDGRLGTGLDRILGVGPGVGSGSEGS